jgi:hypothetical protein
MIITILIGAVLLFILLGKKEPEEPSVLSISSESLPFLPSISEISPVFGGPTIKEMVDVALSVKPEERPVNTDNTTPDIVANIELKPDVSVLDLESGFIPDLKPVEKPAVTKPIISVKTTSVSKPVIEEEPVSVSSTAVKSTGLKKVLDKIK